MRLAPPTFALLLAAAGCGWPAAERGQERVPVALKRDGAAAFDGVRPGDVVNVTGRLASSSAGEAVLSEAGVRAVVAMRPGHTARPELVGKVVTVRCAYARRDGEAHRLTDGRIVVPGE